MKKYGILVFLVFSIPQLSAQTQAEMTAAAASDYKKADAELNRVYKELQSVLDKNEKKLLVKAQRNWITFRDTHCEFEASEFEGGSMQPMMRLACFTECTNNRIENLKANLKIRKN